MFLFSQQRRENLNLLVPEPQVTMSITSQPCQVKGNEDAGYEGGSRMISSPYCAVSEPNVYKHYKRLTRWNANRCHSLRITYLIFETFQTLFPTASLIFTAVKVSSSDISERMKHKSFASKMAVDMKL